MSPTSGRRKECCSVLLVPSWQGRLSFFANISEGGRFKGAVVVEVSGVFWDGVMTGLTLGIGKVEDVSGATEFTRGDRCAILARSARNSAVIGARTSHKTSWRALYDGLRLAVGEWAGLGVYGGALTQSVNFGGQDWGRRCWRR